MVPGNLKSLPGPIKKQNKQKQHSYALLSEDWLTHRKPGILRKIEQLAKGLSKEPHLGDQRIGTSLVHGPCMESARGVQDLDQK